jgi:hypothetical protein
MGQNFATTITGLGGTKSALNVNAPNTVVKSSLGTLFRIVVQVAPSAGSLVVNDLAAGSGYAAANQILSVPFGSLVAGQVITLDWPCLVGIVVPTVCTGGAYAISY